MFLVVKELLRDTLGVAGLAEQLRRRYVAGRNALMKVSSNTGVLLEMQTLLARTTCLTRVERLRGITRSSCLDELKKDKDQDGNSWFLHAAASSNLHVLETVCPADMYAKCCASDRKGWNAFTYAARGQGKCGSDFVANLCEKCLNGQENTERCRTQTVRRAEDEDESTLLRHAAIGRREIFRLVCRMMKHHDLAQSLGENGRDATLLSWAVQGGDAAVINTVAAKIKVCLYIAVAGV